MDNYLLFQITFDYNFLENVNVVLSKCQIIQQSFSTQCSYVIKVKESDVMVVLPMLMNVTYSQIKIQDLNNLDVEASETGTDKPLGSKSAIDEN